MNNINKKIYTSNKHKDELTSYALHCGYVQHRNNKSLIFMHGQYRVTSLCEVEYFSTIKNARLYLYKGILIKE